jgi:hypothetical protein
MRSAKASPAQPNAVARMAELRGDAALASALDRLRLGDLCAERFSD